jgi:pimeloyl-ACP methyl ester carboxylesterase
MRAFNHRMYRWIKLVLPFALAACGGGGGGDGDPPAAGGGERGELVSSVEVVAATPAQVNAILDGLGTTLRARHDVRCHRLVYKTVDVAGSPIDVSGLLCMPIKAPGSPSPMLSFQHGTIFQDTEAPSRLSPGSAQIAIAVAGIGYLCAMPDYIGYADSTDRLHPYQHAATLAASTIDMIRAARRFSAQAGVAGNGQVFLAGYSEGGYATLAAQREIELHHAGEIALAASVPGAGAYDLTGEARRVSNSPTLSPTVVAFLLKAYDHYNNAVSRIRHYFQEPYASVIDSGFDGSQSGAQLDAQLTSVTADLFTPAFLDGFRNAGEPELAAYLAANDIYDWAPRVPTRLFHGQQDEVVSFANATTAAAAMAANGSTSVAIALCVPPNGAPATHGNCSGPYLLFAESFFRTLARDL